MKSKNLVLSVIVLLLLVFSGCREIKVTTIIHRDGSFTRIITVTGEDSSEVVKSNLPFPIDNTWASTFSKDSLDSTKYMVTYTKTFRNSDALNEEIASDTSFYKDFKRKVTIQKRFGFFYTYLEFHEIYNASNPFNFLDPKEYISDEDLKWFNGLKIPVTPEDSAFKDKAEEKVDDFLALSITREVESILENGIKKLDDPSLNEISLQSYRDSMLTFINKSSFSDFDNITDLYAQWTGNPSFLKLKEIIAPGIQEMDMKFKALEQWMKFEQYTETVEMPGLITATNSPMLQGNTISWDVKPDSFGLSDFEMYAESRVINYWAFALAGVVMMLLLVLLVVKALRR